MANVFFPLVIATSFPWCGRILGKKEIAASATPKAKRFSRYAVVFHLTLFSDGVGLAEGADFVVEGRHEELGLV